MSTVKSLISKNYHGAKPPTKDDARVARSHLDRTINLEKQKVKEHETQKTKAKKAHHKGSVKYNESHIKGHKKDIAKREQSKQTISQIWNKLQSLRGKQ